MFEQLLYEHLISCDEIKPSLAVYNSLPAVFNQKAPDDTDPLWAGGDQYGRIVFVVNTQDSPDRVKRGNLIIDAQCRDGKQIPEEMAAAIVPIVDGYFFSSKLETIMAQWQSSDYFTSPTEKICGVTVSFDLLAFPSQASGAPDPIRALNEFTKEIFPDMRVIGYDTLNSVFKPTDANPAMYWRITQIKPRAGVPDTFHMKYRTAVVRGHVFASSFDMANTITRYIDNMTAAKKTLKFPDGTRMRIDWETRIDNTADALNTGQITLETSYGIIPTTDTQTLLNVTTTDNWN